MGARRTTIGLAGVFLLLVTTPTRADDDSDKEQAIALFKEATALHESGDYLGAANLYESAYELAPRPLFLFNIAQVYRLEGDRKSAVEYYEKYLEADPEGKGSETARRFLRELRQELAELETKGSPTEKPKQVAGVTSAGRRPGRTLMWTGVGVAGVGLVALGVGVKFGLDASSISDELSNHSGPWTEELLDKQTEGSRAEDRMLLFTTIGAGALVVGGVVAYLGWRRGDKTKNDSLTVAPTIGLGRAGFVVSGSF